MLGKLFRNNSDEVWLVCGFGNNWDHTSENKMEKTENGFITEIEILNFDKFNFCFKNSENEWDNNNCNNYISTILPPVLPVFDNANDKNVLLDNILSESPDTDVKAFDIDALIDEILNPVINYTAECKKELENIDLLVDEVLESSYVNDIEIKPTACDADLRSVVEDLYNLFEADDDIIAKDIPENKDTALISVKEENNFIVSARKLNSFYMIRKKIKLALYKALVTIPKLLSGEYGNSKNL